MTYFHIFMSFSSAKCCIWEGFRGFAESAIGFFTCMDAKIIIEYCEKYPILSLVGVLTVKTVRMGNCAFSSLITWRVKWILEVGI